MYTFSAGIGYKMISQMHSVCLLFKKKWRTTELRFLKLGSSGRLQLVCMLTVAWSSVSVGLDSKLHDVLEVLGARLL